MMELHSRELGGFHTNSYLLVDPQTNQAALIDAPAEAETLLSWVAPYQVQCILLTHGHADHTGALEAVRRSLAVPVFAHPADLKAFNLRADEQLAHGDQIDLGAAKLEVAHIPGHTPGSVAFKALEPDGFKMALVGDAVFPGGPGHTVSPTALQQSLESLADTVFTWPDPVALYPGHGGPTTVADERRDFERFREAPLPADLCGDVLWR